MIKIDTNQENFKFENKTIYSSLNVIIQMASKHKLLF